MSYVQYSETWPFIPSPVSPSIPRMFGLAVLQNGWSKDNTNVLRCFPIWRTWRWAWSLGEIRSWNISELLPDGGVRAHLLKWKMKKKKKKAMQNKQPSPLHGAAPCGAEPCRGGRRNRRSPAHPTRRHQRRLVPRPLKKGRQSREQQSS